MKLSLPIFSAVLLLAGLTGCKDDDDSPQTPNYGAQYFECKINGVDFVPQGIPFACDGLYFNYYYSPYLNNPPGALRMSGRDCQQYEVVGVRVNGLFPPTQYFSFISPTAVDSGYPYYSFIDTSIGDILSYEKVISGEMSIEHFIPREPGANTPYGSIKGTFNFTVTDSLNTDTFYITDGRFRFNVPQIF